MRPFKFFRGFEDYDELPPLRDWRRIQDGLEVFERFDREQTIRPLSLFGGRYIRVNYELDVEDEEQ